VEPGTWFAAEVVGGKGFALVSCAVAPGFRFEIFEIAQREKLLAMSPLSVEVVRRLTRN
jgi:predicted cupin superfamily sugar epimerase